MSSISEISTFCKSYFDYSLSFIGGEFIVGFPTSIKDLPLTRPTVAMEFKTLSGATGNIRRYQGKKANVNIYGIPFSVMLRFSACVPSSGSGMDCHELIELFINSLIHFPMGDITKIEIGEVSYNRSLSALVIPLDFSINLVIDS